MLSLSFRGKLAAIVVTSALAFVVLIVTSSVMANRAERELGKIQQRYLPKIELAPQLEGDFERLRRALQDAVAAHDLEALNGAGRIHVQLRAELAAARGAVDAAAAERLSSSLTEYYETASEISRRLIAGETGEDLVNAMSTMQGLQAHLADELKKATAFDRGALTEAFASAARAQVTASQVRFAISVLCLVSVILLSVWVGRNLIQSLDGLAAGLKRFGRGDFSQPIQGIGADELGDVARQANQMADNLRMLNQQRDRASWLKNLEAGLGQELRGTLEPGEVAGRALHFLARALEARAGALYYVDPGPQLRLLGHYALSPKPATAAAPGFSPGEGLVGQAALQEDVMLISDPPPEYLRIRSGLGEGAPRVIALVPLMHLGKVAGVMELAMFSDWSDRAGQAVEAVREMLVIAIEVARARAATRQLLGETQRQAQRLTEQEEELRAANEELQSQQQELRQSNRELSNQAEELAAQRTRLEESNLELEETRRGLEDKARELTTVSAYKSQFLANMSHELRTPLNSMLLLSNLLAENQGRNLTDKQVEFAATIHGAGKDLLSLINQVLDLAKIEAGKSEIRIAPTPLRVLVQSLERIFNPLANEKGLRLTTEIAAGVPDSITTDRLRLEQVLKNLIGNAIKFTARGQVTLRVGLPAPDALFQRSDLPPGRILALSVTDTGVGIAPEHQERIFVPFEQVDSAADRRYGGTGLGLGISREVATLLGGELQLDSAVGRGSTFTCYLPFDAPVEAAGDAAVGRPSARGSLGSQAARRPGLAPGVGARNGASGLPGIAPTDPSCLLVIEDDPVFAEAVADIVRAQGLECLIASDGQTGLRIARERRPAGVILDVTLPDLDGWRVMERLRADPLTAAIHVHFVSGTDTPERGMALGAVGYLTKPATPEDLTRAVRTLGTRGNEHARRILVVEDNQVVADSLLRRLADEKMEVELARDAAEARAALEDRRFGCMILDLTLPDMDGLQFLQAMRQRHGTKMPAVVIYTARALSSQVTKTLEAYTEAVVLKDGASTDRLIDEVRLFVRRLQDGTGSSGRIAAPLVPADLRLEGKKILIVDDDMRTAYALSATLRAKGVDVAVADNGQVALDTLVERPDLEAVLMDIMMPGMDGYEAIRRIRSDQRHRDLPIIALTAKAMKGDHERCLQAGANDYMPKPVDIDRLLVLLDKLLSPRASAGARDAV